MRFRSSSPPPTAAGEPTDWAARATGAVETFVEAVRDKSLRPALTVLKIVMLALATLGIVLLVAVLGAVGIVRLLTEDVFAGRVWASDLLLGVLFLVGGAFSLRLSGRAMRVDAHV